VRRAREAVAAVGAPLVLAIIVWLPPWVLLTVLTAAVLLAADELLTMARGAGVACGRWLPLGSLLAVMVAAWLLGPQGLLVGVSTAVLVLPTFQLAAPGRPQGALAGTSVAVFTVAYMALTVACLGWLRTMPAAGMGIRLVLFFLLVIWVGDSGAYYVGRSLGRHRMAPRISPKKTWEGLAGAVVTTYLAAAGLRLALGLELPWIHVAGLATVLAVCAPLGDLVESQFKRDTGVKDSSGLIPGHGGVLDRTDSLFFAAPPVLAYLLLTGRVS
jgi:phosphatidate cytidylyltransferase